MGRLSKDKNGKSDENEYLLESIQSYSEGAERKKQDSKVAKERLLIGKWLKDHKYAVLATSYKDKPWAATVDYTTDDDLNIYIRTKEDSTKYRNLKKNPSVSLVIDSQTKEGTLQVQGEAKTIKTKTKNKVDVLIKPTFIIYRRMDELGEVQMMILNLENPGTNITIGNWYKTLWEGGRGEE